MTATPKRIRILCASTLIVSSTFFGACSDSDVGVATGNSAPPDNACVTSENCPVNFVCEAGTCIPPFEEVFSEEEPAVICIDGETQSCGIDVGACQSGTQTCTNQTWGDCIGNINPINEECNGIDDDCDGEIPEGELDGDGDGLTECEGDCNNSNPNVNPSARESCNGKDDNCNEEIDEGADSICNDNLFCNGTETCVAAQCRPGTPPSCSVLNSQCTEGICDEDIDSCTERPIENTTPCEDGNFCTSNDYCLNGACVVGTPTECAPVTGGDPCYDGVCDEGTNQCIAVENNSCNVCDTGSPIANAGPDQEVIPQDTVTLNGALSTDPDNQNLNYTWTLSEQPSGSSASLENANSVSPSILADIAGTYNVCLSVNDSDGCVSEEDCMTIIVKPQVDFHVELVWDIDSSDLDLHYRAPGGEFFDSCTPSSTDCYYCSTNPDWGLNGEGHADGNESNDPSLDVDNVNGYGPENINLGTLFDHSSVATIGVHYYCNHGGGTATARIRIYVGGELEYELSKVLNQTELWEVADITVSDNGTAVGITPLSTALYPSTTRTCH